MRESIYEYDNYKDFLLYFCKKNGRGAKKTLAVAAEIQTPFLSQIFSGQIHMSLEQALKLRDCLELSTEELEYFLLLVQKERAGTTALKNHFLVKIKAIQKHQLKVENQLNIESSFDLEIQTRFYSSWQYAAVLCSVSLAHIQTVDDIAKLLTLKTSVVREVLDFLLRHNLVTKEGAFYKVANQRTHLNQDSPAMKAHHTQWRLRSIESLLEKPIETDFHYSGVLGISMESIPQFKKELRALVKKFEELMTDSEPDAAFGVCLDFFNLS